ncbi:MAG: hypothetical protein AAGB23_09035 [Pseudomonadota bacterium]
MRLAVPQATDLNNLRLIEGRFLAGLGKTVEPDLLHQIELENLKGEHD